MSLQINASSADSIEFAFDRASFPLFESLALVNNGHESLENLALELSGEPDFF